MLFIAVGMSTGKGVASGVQLTTQRHNITAMVDNAGLTFIGTSLSHDTHGLVRTQKIRREIGRNVAKRQHFWLE